MSKRSGKSVQPKPVRKNNKGQTLENSKNRDKENIDGKKIVNFECFICGFKVDMDKNKA